MEVNLEILPRAPTISQRHAYFLPKLVAPVTTVGKHGIHGVDKYCRAVNLFQFQHSLFGSWATFAHCMATEQWLQSDLWGWPSTDPAAGFSIQDANQEKGTRGCPSRVMYLQYTDKCWDWLLFERKAQYTFLFYVQLLVLHLWPCLIASTAKVVYVWSSPSGCFHVVSIYGFVWLSCSRGQTLHACDRRSCCFCTFFLVTAFAREVEQKPGTKEP